MKNAASKMMWVARATVFMVGLAVTLALVLGVATTALGATGANFILGKGNSAKTTTSLVSTLSKATQAALSVTNKSGGPALSLGVLSGKAPIKVSATAGTATNLSADKLDGKDSSEFLGKSEKAADAAHADSADHATSADSATSATSAGDANTLDGKDSTAFLAANGKAADSDTLDGQDSTAFLGASQKAADSDRLDGKDSSDFQDSYKRTVVVSPVGSAYFYNGQALLNALNGITDASENSPYLVYVEPGTYYLGNSALRMKPYVDIQGAGPNTLITTSSDSSTGCNPTVAGASNAELSSLTVREVANNCAGMAISNGSTGNFRLTNVTVISSVTGASATAVYNAFSSNTTMTNVTAIAAGTDPPAGSPIPAGRYGVKNYNSSPTMINVTTDVRGPNSFGVYNDTSSPTIKQSTLRGDTNSLYQKGGTSNVALTQLIGAVSRPSGTLQCFNNYDQNMAAVTCP